MQLYSMRDPRWRDKEIAPGYSFGCFGHLTTCIAMVASLAGYTDTPPTVAKKFWDAGIYIGRFITRYDKIPTVYEKLVWEGRIDWRGAGADLHKLKSLLSVGPVILEVSTVPRGARMPRDQHYVIGVKLNKTDIEIVDPWTGTCCHLLERYALETWKLEEVILQAFVLRACP